MRAQHLILPALLVLSACSVKKNLDDMHSKTVQLAESTTSLNGKMDNTNDVMAAMAALLKQGDGKKLRDDAIKNMQAADNLMTKADHACTYYFAFEFQTWQPAAITNVDLLKLREALMAIAVRDYAKELTSYATLNHRWDLSATNSDSDSEDLYALVAEMHEVNTYQPFLISGTNVPKVSMYDLIAGSLIKAQDLNRGVITMDQLSGIDKEVLREEQLFTYLMQLRYKVLPVIALGRSSNIQRGFLNGLFNQARMLGFKWDPNLPLDSSEVTATDRKKMNVAQIRYVGDILDRAMETRDLLKRLRAPVKLDGVVKRIWTHANFGKYQDSLSKEARNAALLSEVNRLQSKLSQLLDGDTK